ncbi:MFS general substrate transporter [Lophium mytilinum]|uniref:MFS general substrate transporter n=1 Tax=Lophium mytilinum TaxID=390894 RepID=A0A6A6QX67_9PEZI|nr:MFS general substrate transporter [Lophium mytilinum]
MAEKLEIESTEQAHTAHHSHETHDEIIVQQLETAGREVGFTFKTFLAVASLCICYNAYLFSLNIPATTLSFINADLGPDPRYTWVTISWSLGGAILVTVGGRLSDLFGRRYFFLTGSILVFCGGIIGATGHSISQMIASGVMFGVGSGFLEMSFAAVQEIVPAEWRMFTIGCFEATGFIAQSTPLISWAMIKNTGTWRYAYWYMEGFQGLAVLVIFFFYHPPTFETKHREDHKSRMQIFKDTDFVGFFLFIVGCVILLIGISWGGKQYKWTSAGAIAPIVLGGLTLVALGFWEVYGKPKYPILPPHLFKNVRQMSQLLYATTPIDKGLYAEVLPLGTICGGIWLMSSKKIGHQRWQVTFAIILQTTFCGAMASATLDNHVKSIIFLFIIALCVPPTQLVPIVMLSYGIEDQNDIGVACGIAGTARLLMGATATAIYSSILSNEYSEKLPGEVTNAVKNLGFPPANIPKLIAAAKLGTAKAYAAVPGITPAIEGAIALANKEAYLQAFHVVFLASLAFGCIGVVAAFFTESVDTRKYTKRTFAVVENEHKNEVQDVKGEA